MEEPLPALDMSSAFALLGDLVSHRVVEAVRGTGLRHGHGYLLQRLVVGPATASEIAQELEITQQAVSKAVKELVELGHVELTTDPDDGRRRPVQLTRQGAAAVETARRARRDVDQQIRNAVGEKAFEDTMAVLNAALTAGTL
jgi:DNA-binding MarR family transcriptional regulator